MSPPVALVLVSHVRAAADGVARIAGQMAPDVALHAAGGTEDDGIGTSLDLVRAAVEAAVADADGAGAVVVTDLGSATLTAESVLELAEDDVAGHVELADGPFLEGAVAAAVRAQQGGDRRAVADAVREAGRLWTAPEADPADPRPDAAPRKDAEPAHAEHVVSARVVLPNPLGLHARPAGLLARAVADHAVPLTIDGVDGASVLQLMALGATGGHELEVRAHGAGAGAAVDAVVAMVREGFGEL